MTVRKIHIIGSVGSGKTTFAKKLVHLLSIPMYELDNVVWRRTASEDVRISTEERDEKLKKIVQTDEWIIEGAHHEWVLPSFQQAQIIFVLDIPYYRRLIQINKRFLRQKLRIEQANYNPTFTIYKKMFEWSLYYEKEQRAMIFHMLQPFQDKVVHLRTINEMEMFLRDQRNSKNNRY